MAKSISVLVAITILISVWSTTAYSYVSGMVGDYIQRLDELSQKPDEKEIKAINDDWEKDKRKLMYIMNHRDVEQVSEALLRGKAELLSGRIDMALQEIDVARFYLSELTEREKLSIENLL